MLFQLLTTSQYHILVCVCQKPSHNNSYRLFVMYTVIQFALKMLRIELDQMPRVGSFFPFYFNMNQQQTIIKTAVI